MVKNQTIWTEDNLHILRGLNSDMFDLIYLDPPFNSKRNYSAPIGSNKKAEVVFKDVWALKDVKNAWHGDIAEEEPAIYEAIRASEITYDKSMKAYLIMMAVRLIEMKRILKPTGSIYLHCDPTASHYLKLLMDSIFGHDNFKNEITWERIKGAKGTTAKSKQYPRNSDRILFYAMPNAKFDQQYTDLSEGGLAPYKHKDKDGRIYRLGDISNPGGGGYEYDLGFGEVAPRGGYRMPEKTAREWLADGTLIVKKGKVPARKRYLKDSKGALVPDLWSDIGALQDSSKEKIHYPTQKPLALLERIIKASTNEGDFILDPFCGCATALVAAEKLGRQWVGIDIVENAYKLVIQRVAEDEDEELKKRFKPIHRKDVPKRTDLPTQKLKKVDEKRILFGKQQGICGGCKEPFGFHNMTIDHIVPRAKGGGDYIENKQLLCSACNSLKGIGSHEELLVKIKKREKFSAKYSR